MGELRPASQVMTPERIGRVWPTRLSFAQSAIRALVRSDGEVRRTRFALDDEGRGRASYTLDTADGPLSFHVFSYKLAPEEQEDRIIATKWDAVAYLRLGLPAPGELDECEREIPKVIRGRAAPGTLVWTRANRSSRLVDRAVASLADGRQPDVARIEKVGYLLRTTGFSANGRNGTVAYELLKTLGPLLAGPYNAQMIAAFLWREFSFDLVEHLASRLGGTLAAALEPAVKRGIGVGNSSGIGLAPFIVRHPKLVNGWVLARELALAEVCELRVGPRDPRVTRLAGLLAETVRHFRARPAQGGFFAAPSELAAELARAASALDELVGAETPGSEVAVCARLRDWSERRLGIEAQEAVNSLMLEGFADVTDRYEPMLMVEETMELDPSLSVGKLRDLLDDAFSWVWDEPMLAPGADHYFWYLSEENFEPRRGLRSDGRGSRFELPLNFPGRMRELAACLEAAPATMPVARFLVDHSDFRLLATWAAGLADCPYALPRVNMLAQNFVPLEVMRFQLALYGMTSLIASSHGWVRGTLHQGAPTASDLPLAGGADYNLLFPPPGAGA
jgi:hypothetical protein